MVFRLNGYPPPRGRNGGQQPEGTSPAGEGLSLVDEPTLHIPASTPTREGQSSPRSREFASAAAASSSTSGHTHPRSAGTFPKVSSNFDPPNASSRRHTQSPSAPSDQGTIHERSALAHDKSAAHVVHPNHVPAAVTATKSRLTFAQTAARKAAKPPDMFVHNINSIKPVKMNDGMTVFMPEDLYAQRLRSFEFALIGRIFLPQGTVPRGNDDLKSELSRLFKTLGEWVLMPLGKGFFSLKFTMHEDQIKASRMGSWKLNAGSFQIREWKPDFNPYKELSSSVQVWVRLFNLPAEYWHPEFLVGIFRSVGNVIKLDGNTAHGLVGHFARALVEVDLRNPLLDSVRVGLPENLFYVDFSYENVPMLCSFCKSTGHSADRCRKAKAAAEAKASNGPDAQDTNAKDKTQPTKKVWVEKPVHNTDNVADHTAPLAHVRAAAIARAEAPVPSAPVHSDRASDPPLSALAADIPTSNPFDALADGVEDEVVRETPPASDLLALETSDQGASSKENDALKHPLIKGAKDRLKQLRTTRKVNRLAKGKEVSANQIGLLLGSSLAHQRIADSLSKAIDAGACPTAYVLDTGDTRSQPTSDPLALDIPTSNPFDAVANGMENEMVRETPPSQPTSDPLALVTSDQGASSKEKHPLIEGAKDRMKQPRPTRKSNRLAKATDPAMVSANHIGHLLGSSSAHQRIADRLTKDVDAGACPTAYVLDPGDTRRANVMNAMDVMNIVASKKWADLMEADTEDGEDSDGLS